MDDEIIAQFRSPRGFLLAERRNRGSTLHEAWSGVSVARLRPTEFEGHFEVLHGSLWKERWCSTGPSGSTVLACIAAEDIVRVRT